MSQKNKYSSIIIASIIGLIFILSAFTFFPDEKQSNADSTNNINNTPYKIQAIAIPDQISFCNEPMPIKNFDTYESLDREILVNTYWQSQTILFIKRANRYFPIIEPILKEHEVPDDFKYLALAESGLSNVVSPAGAKGFWQFLKGTATDYKLEVNEEVDERYHIEKSTHAAAQFLRESYEKFGSWTLAAATYNMGRRNISKYIELQKSKSYYDLVLGDETGRYVYRITALKLIIESPEQYGFFIAEDDKYKPVKYTTVTIDSSIHHLADFANYHGINYKTLKELNPWLRDNKLTNKYKKTYTIKIADKSERLIEENKAFY